MRPIVFIAVGLLALAGLILAHHFAKHGYLIDHNDINNHEFFVAIFGALGAGALLGGLIEK